MPNQCSLIHFDDIGVPSFQEMKREYGSIEEWQRIKTLEWVERLAKENLLKAHIIFDAQVRPSFISEACDFHGVDYEVVLLDCSDEQRAKRLALRGHRELADENMMNWAAFLRNECQKHNHKIINNTHITIDQTFQLFSTWLEYQFSEQLNISVETVIKLIETQFPEYSKLSIKAVEPNGSDNRTFRLGDKMSIRLPSAQRYASKVLLEHKWLPKLAACLSTPIAQPIAKGKSTEEYPWNWSIYGWIEGKSLNTCEIDDAHLEKLAAQLAHFLKELQAIDPTGGPKPGAHNFFRGESPIVYDAETRSSIDNLVEYIDVKAAVSTWEKAIRLLSKLKF